MNKSISKTITNTITAKESFNQNMKKLEEMKLMYKKLITKSISFNFHKGAFDEIWNNLKRLQSVTNQKELTLELIFLDIYIFLIDFYRNDVINLHSSFKKLLSKIKKIDIDFDFCLTEFDKNLFKKIAFDLINKIITDIISDYKEIPIFFTSFDLLITNLMSKENLLSFAYTMMYLISIKLKNSISASKSKSELKKISESLVINLEGKTIETSNYSEIKPLTENFIQSLLEFVIYTEETLSSKGISRKPLLTRKSSVTKIKDVKNTEKISISPKKKNINKLTSTSMTIRPEQFPKNLMKNSNFNHKLCSSPLLSNKLNTINIRSISEFRLKKNELALKNKSIDLSIAKVNSNSTHDLSNISPSINSNQAKKDKTQNTSKIRIDSACQNESKIEDKCNNFKNIENIISRMDSNFDRLTNCLNDYGNYLEELKELKNIL